MTHRELSYLWPGLKSEHRKLLGRIPAGTTLKELQSGLDKENPHAPGGMLLTNIHVKLKTGVEPKELQPGSLVLSDGTALAADVIIYPNIARWLSHWQGRPLPAAAA